MWGVLILASIGRGVREGRELQLCPHYRARGGCNNTNCHTTEGREGVTIMREEKVSILISIKREEMHGVIVLAFYRP